MAGKLNKAPLRHARKLGSLYIRADEQRPNFVRFDTAFVGCESPVEHFSICIHESVSFVDQGAARLLSWVRFGRGAGGDRWDRGGRREGRYNQGAVRLFAVDPRDLPEHGRIFAAVRLLGDRERFPDIDAERGNLSGYFRIEKHHAAVNEREHEALSVLRRDDLALAIFQGHGYRDVEREVHDFARWAV